MTYAQTAFTGRTGARPITEMTRRIARDLEARFSDAVEISEWKDLYRVVDQAAISLGLGAGARETLKHLIGYTRLEDWKDGRTPVVWPSNQTLADAAGKTVGAIKARLRQLRDTALILARDSGHGRRTGRRDDSGAITSAFGVDLSPIRVRFPELRERAETYTAQSRLFREGKQEIGRVRRTVGQALAQAAHLRLTGAHWIMLQDAIDQVAGMAAAAKAVRDSAAYQAALDRLQDVDRLVAETIDRFMFSSENDGLGSKNSRSINIQTNPPITDNVQNDRGCSSDPTCRIPPLADLPASPSNSAFKAKPAELMEMFPTTAAYVAAKNPRWSEIHAAACRLRHDLGIRIGTYVDALEKLGPDATAVAVMITAERYTRDEIRLTAGAYFAGMVGKAKRDELDLAKSLWGFRTERMALQ
ncbi:plasmid replication protein RepC [Sphingomonas sp. GC_Shp_3]|uniref:plasmid replication protein RepC n=1 Tax=Sphingomonas sp. GC_Shp_3 TaxID=2937383 RepID=UPI00226A8EA0|nr:plasmid replication protein RepC [Sphingomonas sp. GC_Shp_3]